MVNCPVLTDRRHLSIRNMPLHTVIQHLVIFLPGGSTLKSPNVKLNTAAKKFTMSLDLGTSIIVVHNVEMTIFFKIIRPNFRKI